MVSQECVAGTSNVPPPAAAAATVDTQLPEVMIRDERNANREDKVNCLFLLCYINYPASLLASAQISIVLVQDMEPTVVNGSGTETGQVITTTVGGRDGKPKQVNI